MLFRSLLLCIVLVASSITFASSVSADPGCVNGGVYVLFARGSGSAFNSAQAKSFRDNVKNKLDGRGLPSAWAELGNLDNDFDPQSSLDTGEYPATRVDDWHALPPFYGPSVEIGMRELVTHLNQRYDPNYPGGRRCATEKVVIGGYSQGADVVGWALRRYDLSAAAKSHIAYVALYGDPKLDAGQMFDRMRGIKPWWVRGDNHGFRPTQESFAQQQGILGSRSPYVPSDFNGRFGSWCDDQDGVCTGSVIDALGGTHGNAYQDRWIGESAIEIANVVTEQQGYFHGVPSNGAVIENHDGGGHKYVALGGALIYIPSSDDIWGYVSQIQRLYPSGQFHDILRMHNDEIHALEANWGGSSRWPGDNSFFYERGSPTQYIMQYGLAFPIASVDELSYLNGMDRAVMVPAGSLNAVKGSSAKLPAPPNGTILQTIAISDPDYEYQPDKLYWANNYTVQECIKVVKGAGTQRIPQSMADLFRAAGRYQGNISGCDFGYGRVLYGPKDDGSPGNERWYMYGDNTPAHPYKRYRYASPFALQCRHGLLSNEVMISRQGLNEAPVGEDLQCPDNSAVRNRSNGEVYWVTGGVLHLVPSYDALACLTQGIPGNPTDMDESLLSTVPRGGSQACSFANRLLRGPDGKMYWVDAGGQRHYVGNYQIQNCIAVRAGASNAWNMPQPVLDHIPEGSGAFCPYPDSMKFIRGDGQPEVWVVYPDSTRRHALALCEGSDPRFQVWVVPAGEVDGHRYIGDFSPTVEACSAL